MIFVGGGVISLEFGHVYARAGAGVTILEALPQMLPAVDADAVARRGESERIGIRVMTAVVKRIDRVGGRLRVLFAKDSAEHTIEADRSSIAPGGSPISTLDLGAGKVAHCDGRIAIDAFCARPRILPSCLRRRRAELTATFADRYLRGPDCRPQHRRGREAPA